jgi:hypothetical protein
MPKGVDIPGILAGKAKFCQAMSKVSYGPMTAINRPHGSRVVSPMVA